MFVTIPHPMIVWVRWLARLWGAAAALVFLWLAVSQGPPQAPDGLGSIEDTAQQVLVLVVAAGVLLAWRWPAIGGAAVMAAALGLGVLATVAFHPARSFLIFAVAFTPGVLFELGRREHVSVRWLAGLASVTAAVLVLGGIVSQRIYDYYYGPSHPQSSLAAEPVDLVEWIWSGGVTTDAVVINARIARDAVVRVALSDRADMDTARHSTPIMADDDTNDRVISVRFDGLLPGVQYYYAVEANGRPDRSRQGQFRTFPDGPASFSFAFGSCARTGSNGAVYDTIRGLEPLFYLNTGDFFYGDINANDPAQYRADFDRTLTAPAQAALYRSLATAYVWDDHDFGTNNSDPTSPGRMAALRTYRQYVPHYPLMEGDAPIYQAFSAGRVRFILLDLRSARTPDSAPDTVAKSLLGAEQKAWLERELITAAVSHPLIVLVSAVPWIASASAGGDNWGGYATERRELADFLVANGIRNLLMLTGDAHMLAIDDGRHSGYASAGGDGFPVMNAAALDRPGSAKGGPYSEGMYPGGGQFGLVSVHDEGGATIEVVLSGRDWTGREIVGYRFSVPAGDVAGEAAGR